MPKVQNKISPGIIWLKSGYGVQFSYERFDWQFFLGKKNCLSFY